MLASSADRLLHSGEVLWVFGYGSLLWKPGFPYQSSHMARIYGVHRALCIYSWVHRGTRQHPGLVMGLDKGGSCKGLLFEVSGNDRAHTVQYLREREQVTAVYLERWYRARRLSDGVNVQALVYCADRNHAQYAGDLDPDTTLALVRQGVGKAGINADYVLNTHQRLQSLGITDPKLRRLAHALNSSITAPV